MTVEDPVKLLERFLEKSGQSKAEFARATGIGPTFLVRILSRKRRPGAEAISAIDHGTGGKVPSRLWGDFYRQIDGGGPRRKAAA